MTKTIYAINGKNITLVTPVVSPAVESIPPAVYRIHCDREGIHLIHMLDKFDLPSHFFGDINTQHDILVKDYHNAAVGKKSTGVILAGVKGCGKTLLMEKVSNTLISMDIPVISVEENIPAFVLRKVIRSAGPCCVLFDEFEKNYESLPSGDGHKTSQTELLTLFSDSSLKGVMFMIASNTGSMINTMYIDRPGRLKRYMRFNLPGFQHFTQIAKEKGVFDQIDQYTKMYIEDYFTCMTNYGKDYGIDVVMELVEIVSESNTLYEFLRNTMYSNLPQTPVIGRSISAIHLNSETAITHFFFETDGEKVKIQNGESEDYFTLPETFHDLKSDWRGKYFEVDSEGGTPLKVHMTPPDCRAINPSILLAETEQGPESDDDQKKFFRKWNGVIPATNPRPNGKPSSEDDGEASIGKEDLPGSSNAAFLRKHLPTFENPRRSDRFSMYTGSEGYQRGAR